MEGVRVEGSFQWWDEFVSQFEDRNSTNPYVVNPGATNSLSTKRWVWDSQAHP